MFMFSIAGYLSSSDEEDDIYYQNARVTRKYLRDKSNPLDMPANLFIKLFRVNKFIFKYILDEVSVELKTRYRSTSVPTIIKLSAALRFYAEGGFQKGIGQDYLVAMAQSTTSEAIEEITNAIEKALCPKWISFRQTNVAKIASKQHFFEKYRIPGVVGCIGGTHIAVCKPNESEHNYFNRKGYHSLNVMLMCDHNMTIRCVDARYGGAANNSFIWDLSSLRKYLKKNRENGDTSSWLLGDSGYPLEPWLITPFRLTSEGSREARFNTKHAEARNIIERTNSLLKSRFRCLLKEKVLYYAPKKATRFINSCCALHNILIYHRIPFEEIIEIPNEDSDEDVNEEDHDDGRRIRNAIMDALIQD